MKILVVDFLEEPGHIAFNHRLLEILRTSHDVCFTSSAPYIQRLGWPETLASTVPMILSQPKGNPFGFRINQCLRYFWLYFSGFFEDFDLVIFSSYETISFALASRLFNSKKVMLVDHNNLDQLNISKIKRFLFSMIPQTYCHLGLETYIEKHLKEDLKVQASHLPYPCPEAISISEDLVRGVRTETRIQVFAPSRAIPPEVMENLALKLVPPERFFLVARATKAIYPEGLMTLVKENFDNYDDLLLLSDYVFIGGVFDYRVSAVCFEAITNGRPVLIQPCRFGIEMKLLWPAQVHLTCEFTGSSAVKTALQPATPTFVARHSDASILKAIDNAIRDMDMQSVF